MNASDYLKRSTLYRKLIHGPHGKFAQVYAARLSNEGLGRQCTWRSLSLFRELMDWHVGSGHEPRDLSEGHVSRFFEHRFKHWRPDARPISSPPLTLYIAARRFDISRRSD